VPRPTELMDGPRRCSCANTFLTDDDYVDWPVLPEAPSSLAAVVSGARCGYAGKGTAAIYATPLSSDVSAKLARGRASPTQPAGTPDYVDTGASVGGTICYLVRAMGANGESAYSNIVRVRR